MCRLVWRPGCREREAARPQKSLPSPLFCRCSSIPHDDARDDTHGHVRALTTHSHTHCDTALGSFTHMQTSRTRTVTHRLRHLMHQSPSVCQQNTKAIQRANRSVEEDGPECRPRRSGRHGPRDARIGHRAGMGPRKPLGWCAPLPCGRASHCKGAVCSHSRHARQVLSGEQLPQAVEA